MPPPQHDPRVQQALFMEKGQDKGDDSVKGGIWKAVLLIGLPIIAVVVVGWWMFFA